MSACRVIFMDFLWTFGKMDARRLSCVRQSVKLVQPVDTVTCIIRDDETITCDFPEKSLILRDSLALKMALDETDNPEFWRKYISRPHFPQARSDFLRLWYATKKPHLYYMDTDVRLFRVPEFEAGKPYLGQFGRRVDFFMFYVNERCDWFQCLMERIERCNPLSAFIPFLLADQRIMQAVGVIERRWFRHERSGK